MSTPFNRRTIRQMMVVLLPSAQWLRDQQRRRTTIGLALTGPLLALVMQSFRAVWQPQLRNMQTIGDALLLGGGFSLALFLTLVVLYQLGWVLLQFRPTDAVLLPHLRSRLVWAAAVPTLGLPLLFSIASSLLVTQQPEPLIWLGGVTAILIWFTMVRSLMAGMGMVLAWLLSVWAMNFGPLQTLTEVLQSAPALVALAGLACTVMTLRWVFDTRGDAYLDAWKLLAGTSAGRAGQMPSQGTAQPGWRRFARYVRWRMQQSTQSDAMLHCYATGPNLHWSSFSTGFIWMGIGALALLEAKRSLADGLPMVLVLIAWWWVMFLPLAFISQIAGLPRELDSSRAERALMQLAERAPHPTRQRQLIFAYLRRQSLLLWGAMMVVQVATSWRYLPLGVGPLPVMALDLSLLPGLMWFIRPQLFDTSRSTNQSVTMLLTWWFMILSLSITAGWAVTQDDHKLWLWCAGLLTLTLVIGFLRGRQMRVDAALPTCRRI